MNYLEYKLSKDVVFYIYTKLHKDLLLRVHTELHSVTKGIRGPCNTSHGDMMHGQIVNVKDAFQDKVEHQNDFYIFGGCCDTKSPDSIHECQYHNFNPMVDKHPQGQYCGMNTRTNRGIVGNK